MCVSQSAVKVMCDGVTHNNMARRQHLDDFTRGRIIGKLEEGRSVTSVAQEFGIAHSIVSRAWRAFRTTGTAVRGRGGGRPRSTTAADDRYIVQQARRDPRQTAGAIANTFNRTARRPISRSTVARRLHRGGLFARRPLRCVPLRPAHRRHRLRWCQEHQNWTEEEWGRVLFSDESRFSLSSDSGRTLIWREVGTRNEPRNIVEHDRFGGPGVLVWGGIMLHRHTDLQIFEHVTLNGQRYCDSVLLPHVRRFRGEIGPDFIFMDDNARPHRTAQVAELLVREDIRRMEWPACSPDLNPIEHVWDAMGRRLAARRDAPRTIQQLSTALVEEWNSIPQELITNLVRSMGARCRACIAVRGDHTPF